MLSARMLLIAAFVMTLPAAGRAQSDCAGALGTARTLAVGTEGGLEIGLKSYPRTLPLAEGEFVLTFDDGPLPATTGPVLDALKRECVKATFFLVGRNAQANPDMVKRMLRDGHTVGHHSYSHPALTLRGISDAAARSEIDHGFAADDQAAYGEAGGPKVPFFRFPGFADTRALDDWLASRNIAVFGADLWASDWYPMTPAAQLSLLMGRVDKAGRGIILLHDTRAQTAAMLPAFLNALKERGYRIVHIVPRAGRSETLPAPPGWSSETEAALAKIMPRLLQSEHGERAAVEPR